VTQGKLNPRFVVSNLGVAGEGEGALAEEWSPEEVYAFYCGRGANPENRIKEFTVDLKGDRLSCQEFLANQFRLLLHVGAYLLIQTVQRGLAGTEWASAQAGRIRVSLLKVAARVLVRCRGVRVQLPTSYPWQPIWRQLVQRLQEARGQPPGYAVGTG